jgi:hypothetical protein
MTFSRRRCDRAAGDRGEIALLAIPVHSRLVVSSDKAGSNDGREDRAGNVAPRYWPDLRTDIDVVCRADKHRSERGEICPRRRH